MGFRVEFEDGQSVEFDAQPTPADIEEAHTHLKASATPKPVAAQGPTGVDQIPGQVRPAEDPTGNSNWWDKINAGVEAGVNTGAGLLGAMTTGPLAAATNLANTAIREGRLATPKELGDKFNEGAGIMTDFLGKNTTPLGQEYTQKAGDVMNDILPAMMHFQTSGGHMPSFAEAKAGLGVAKAKEAPVKAPTGSLKLDALDSIDQAPKAPTEAPVTTPEIPTGKPLAERFAEYQRQKKLAEESAFNPKNAPPEAIPEVPPVTDTRSSSQRTLEAYQAALREKELAQQSAFNRPDSLPDLTEQQSPMQRMAQDLGAPELSQESFGNRSGVGDMANQLITGDRPVVDTLSPAETAMKTAQEEQARVAQQQKEQQARYQAAQDVINNRQNSLYENPAVLHDAITEQIQTLSKQLEEAKTRAKEAKTQAESIQAVQEARRIKAEVEQHQKMRQSLIDDTEHVLPDTNQVIAPQYGATQGVGRFDENGMPIRADLSMEAQHLEHPDQMGLWGDELAPKHELEITKMPPLGSMARAALRKRQGGMVNPKVFQEGFQKVKELANGIILKATGHGDSMHIEATRNGKHIGGVMFDKTNPQGLPMHSDAMGKLVGSKEKGTATEMYRFGAELGNDIVPSGKFTPDGKKMWEGFASKGLSREGYIPKGQRGGVNIAAAKGAINQVAHLASDVTTKLSDFFKEVANYRYKSDTAAKDYLSTSHSETMNAADKFAKPMDPTAVIAKVLAPGATDLPTMNVLSRSLQSGMDLMASKFKEHPLMIEASRVLTYAAAKTQLQVRTMVKPLEKIYSSLPTKDMIEVQGALKKEQMRNAPYTESQLRGAGFNERQIEAYKMQRDAYKTALDVQNKSRAALGMDPVSKLDQYYSSVWHGDWHMPILDKQGKLAWYIRTTTRSEGKKALAYLKDKMGDQLDLDKSEPQFRGSKTSTSGPTDVVGAYHDMQGFFKDDPTMAKAIENALGGYMESKGYGLAGQSKHFLQKANIRGFEGDKPWLSDKENAYSGAKAQINYLKNALRWSNHQEAISNVKQVLSNPDVAAKMPNAVEYAHSVLAHEAGSVPALTNSIENSLAQLTGRSKSNLYQGIGDLKTGMYLQSLGLNTAYMIATPLQYAITGPAWHAVLSAQGFKTGIAGGAKTIGLAFTDASAGILSHMAHELGMPNMKVPMSKIGERALQYAEDAGIVSRNLFDEGGGIGEHAAFSALKNGLGWTIGFPEKVARMNAFMGFVHHLEASGKYAGKELEMFRHAEEYTGRAMTSFMSHDRPQAVSNMGGLGQLGYVYKSYVFNQAHTMNAMGRMAGKGNFLPLASLVGGYALMSGVTNMPVVNELDGLWNATKDVMANYYPEEYVKHNMVDKDLKAELVKLLPESAGIRSVLQQGLATRATGADLGSHLSSQILDTEHPTQNIPGAAPAQEVKEWGSVGKTLYHRDSDSVMSALHANAPPLIKGIMENNVKNFSQGAGTNSQLMYKPDELNTAKTMEHRRTLDDQAYRGMGLTSYNEAQDKRNIFRTNQDEMRNTSALAKLKEHVASGIKNLGNGGEERAAQALVAYKTLNPSANISDVIKSAGMSVYTTPMEQKELNMRSIRMMQYYQRYVGQPK